MLEQYAKFVDSRLSEDTKDINKLTERMYYLHKVQDVHVGKLMAGACGLCSETGEFMEIVKKVVFQGKTITPEVIHHTRRELGDILFYWITACMALGYSPEEVIEENQAKLRARYPDGFTVQRSEVREEADV